MSTSNRPERVAGQIQQILGELFARGLKDPRVGFVTVTGAKVSADLRNARVYWAVHGDEAVRKSTAAGLEAAKGFLRREVGQRLGLRITPELAFSYDEAIDRGARVEELLREAREQDARRAAESSASNETASQPESSPRPGGAGGSDEA